MNTIYRVYNNLPKNRKTKELEEYARKLQGYMIDDADMPKFVDIQRTLLDFLNAKYPNTTTLCFGAYDDLISFRLDGSDKNLGISFAKGDKVWQAPHKD